jgi:hypothetical protein
VYNMGGGERGPQTDKSLPPSTFIGQFLRKVRKSQHLGFGVFIVIWSMTACTLFFVSRVADSVTILDRASLYQDSTVYRPVSLINVHLGKNLL